MNKKLIEFMAQGPFSDEKWATMAPAYKDLRRSIIQEGLENLFNEAGLPVKSVKEPPQ